MSKTDKAGAAFPDWDFARAWAGLKIPGLDAAAQKKNLEALDLAGKTAVEGWQALARKQAEFWLEAAGKAGALMQDVAAAAEPKDKLEKQAEFAKTAVRDGLAGAREAQALASETADAALAVVSGRWLEAIDEVVSFAAKAPAAPKTAAA